MVVGRKIESMVVGRKVISGDDQYARQTGKNVECKQNAKSSVYIE